MKSLFILLFLACALSLNAADGVVNIKGGNTQVGGTINIDTLVIATNWNSSLGTNYSSTNLNIGGSTGFQIPAVLGRDATLVSVSNTLTTTAIYSNVITGGVMGANRLFEVMLFGDLLNNSGTSTNMTLQITFGSGTNCQDLTTVINTSASRRSWRINAVVANTTSGAQVSWCEMFVGVAGAATAGNGRLNSTSFSVLGDIVNASTAVDTTTNNSLVVNVTLPVTGIFDFRKLYGVTTLY